MDRLIKPISQVVPIRPDRIDPARLVDGRVPVVRAEHRRTVRRSGFVGRHYYLTGGMTAHIQLNGGEKAGDPARLREILEFELSRDTE